MTTLSLDDALSALHRAATRTDDATFASALAEARSASGIPDEEIPAYLPRALSALADGTAAGGDLRDPSERGYAWLLRDFEPLIPGSVLIDEVGRDGLAVPSLHRALVIHRGPDERWEVVPWAGAGATAPRVLDTFAPTPAQVDEWARDRNVRFAEQDEDLAISRPEYLAQLIQLAADPSVPRRDEIRRILDRITALMRPDALDTLTRARELARASGDDALRRWADDLDLVATHLAGRGAVDQDTARTLARIALIGVRRPHLVLDESTHGDWWQFRARGPEPADRGVDSIYVHAPTGAVVWSWDPLDDAQLAARVTDDRAAAYTLP